MFASKKGIWVWKSLGKRHFSVHTLVYFDLWNMWMHSYLNKNKNNHNNSFFKYFLCSKNCDDLFILPLENRSFLEKNAFHNLRATHSHASLQMSSLFLVRLRKLLFPPRVSPHAHIHIQGASHLIVSKTLSLFLLNRKPLLLYWTPHQWKTVSGGKLQPYNKRT